MSKRCLHPKYWSFWWLWKTWDTLLTLLYHVIVSKLLYVSFAVVLVWSGALSYITSSSSSFIWRWDWDLTKLSKLGWNLRSCALASPSSRNSKQVPPPRPAQTAVLLFTKLDLVRRVTSLSYFLFIVLKGQKSWRIMMNTTILVISIRKGFQKFVRKRSPEVTLLVL